MKTMEYINMRDLSLLGKGANSKVYKYNKPLSCNGLEVVVKITSNARKSLENYEKLKQTGCEIVYAELCYVDGEEAILMQNLYTDNEVYVSPNSYRNGYVLNLPEAYLISHKIKGIANLESLLYQLLELARNCDSLGIELLIDMISFGVPKDVEIPDVSYKVVDVDCMLQSDDCKYKLFENNKEEVKWAMELFIKYCVDEKFQDELKNKVDRYKW